MGKQDLIRNLSTPGDNQSQIVCHFSLVSAELESGSKNGIENVRNRHTEMAADYFKKPVLAKLFALRIVGFGDAVRIDDQDIAASDLNVPYRRLPLFK